MFGGTYRIVIRCVMNFNATFRCSVFRTPKPGIFKPEAKMKIGDEIVCPHCGKDSFASKKTEMDGWTKVGEIFVCAACGAKLADCNDSATENRASDAHTPALSSLAAALGVEETNKPSMTVSEDEKRFCRDCVHFISHPFLNRCSLLGQEVAPMDDCDKFKVK